MVRGKRFAPVLAAVLITLGACTTTLPEDPDERAEIESLNDPFEPTNRTIFEINMALDEAVMVPVAEGYRDTLPDWLRESIHNILSNLQEPYVAGNDLLQGNPRAAADALGRFFVNSTFGFLGAHDAVAGSGGAKPHKTDIGVTLAVWGVDDGPYLMLPLFGPSSLRDGAGKVADYWASPTGAMFGSVGLGVVSDVQSGVDLLDTRATLLDPMNELRRTSLDEYAAIRSLYRQSRDAALAESRSGQMSSPRPAPAAPAPSPAAATGVGASGAKHGAAPTPALSGRVDFVEPAPAASKSP